MSVPRSRIVFWGFAIPTVLFGVVAGPVLVDPHERHAIPYQRWRLGHDPDHWQMFEALCLSDVELQHSLAGRTVEELEPWFPTLSTAPQTKESAPIAHTEGYESRRVDHGPFRIRFDHGKLVDWVAEKG